MTVARIFTKIYIFISLSWAFFENRKNSGLTPGQNDDPVSRTWKMTQMTGWPGDPMTQFHVCCYVCLCVLGTPVSRAGTAETIAMPFREGKQTRVGPRNQFLYGGPHPPRTFEGTCAGPLWSVWIMQKSVGGGGDAACCHRYCIHLLFRFVSVGPICMLWFWL